MLRWLADENFNHAIVRGLLRLRPDFDIVRAQDVDLSATDDPIVLEWAAQAGRIVLTHDILTITFYAYERVRHGQKMSGVLEVSRAVPIGRAIEEILIMDECSFPEEWEDQVRYVSRR